MEIHKDDSKPEILSVGCDITENDREFILVNLDSEYPTLSGIPKKYLPYYFSNSMNYFIPCGGIGLAFVKKPINLDRFGLNGRYTINQFIRIIDGSSITGKFFIKENTNIIDNCIDLWFIKLIAFNNIQGGYYTDNEKKIVQDFFIKNNPVNIIKNGAIKQLSSKYQNNEYLYNFVKDVNKLGGNDRMRIFQNSAGNVIQVNCDCYLNVIKSIGSNNVFGRNFLDFEHLQEYTLEGEKYSRKLMCLISYIFFNFADIKILMKFTQIFKKKDIVNNTIINNWNECMIEFIDIVYTLIINNARGNVNHDLVIWKGYTAGYIINSFKCSILETLALLPTLIELGIPEHMGSTS